MMKQIALFAALLSALWFAVDAGAMPLNAPGTTVVPAVKSRQAAEGVFTIGPTLTVSAPGKCEMALQMLEEALAERETRLKRVAEGGDCVFSLAEGFAPEAYRLEIAPAGIRITASTDRGLFYGAQTLIPLVRGAGKDRKLAACVIDDRPDLKVRGMQFTLRYLDSQNLPDFKRMVRGLWICLWTSMIAAGVIGWGMFLSGEALLGLINANIDVIKHGMIRARTNLTTYFLMGAMEVFNSGLRGTGRSVVPAISTFTSICILRIVWIYTAFRWNPTLETLVISYPLSWIVVVLWNGGMLFFVCRKLLRNGADSSRYATVKTR